MYLNHFETSSEARLSQVLATLKNIHGVEMKVDLDSPTATSLLENMRSSWEVTKDRIVSGSSFNSYQQNPEYIKTMLILEAVRIMLKEIAPKRRRTRIAESKTNGKPDDDHDGIPNWADKHPKNKGDETDRKVDEAAKDQDGDGKPGEFDDVRVARMVAGGVPKKIAIAKVNDRKLEEELPVGADGPDMGIPATPQITQTQAHHYEYQASMARSELYRNAKYATSMINQVDPTEEVTPWIAGALTKAANYLDKIYHYLDYYQKFEPQELPEDMDQEMELGETSGSITRQNLMLIIEYSTKLFEMIKPGDKLEGWVAMKITTASECISSCKHYMDYVQFEKHAMDDHFNEGRRTKRKIMNETAYERDLDEKKPVYAEYLHGVKSTPKKKKFRNYAEYEKWFDKEGDNVQVNRVYNESRRLMEQEDLAKASTILGAKEMSNKIQDIAEDVAKMSVEELMPLVDIMRGQFGPEAASGFNETVKAALESLLDLATKTKESMDQAIDTLNSGGVPAETSDLENADMGTEAGDEPTGDESGTETDGGEAGGDEGLPDLGDIEEPEATEPLGRSKKADVAENTIPTMKPKKIGEEDGSTADELAKMAKDGKTKDNKPLTPQQKAAAQKASDELNKANLSEKSVSKAQQRLMGAALAAKKGNKAASPEIKKIAKGMSKKDLEDFAGTKHDDLPERVKEARDFINRYTTAYMKKHGEGYQNKLYADAWREFGNDHSSYIAESEKLAKAREVMSMLEHEMANHRKVFKRKLAEGKASDPLKMGYGLEGDAILDKMAMVEKMMASAKASMKDALREGVLGMLRGIETLNKSEALENIKNKTPYGVVYTTKSGKKSQKMFESAEARAYWLELRGSEIQNPRMVEPETFEKAITKIKG